MRELVEDRVVLRGDCVAVERRPGLGRRRAAVVDVRRVPRLVDEHGAPAVVVDLAQITERGALAHAKHLVEAHIDIRGGVSQ